MKMAFQNNIAVALCVNGKVLRENKGVVTLPFGSEYSILIKNNNSVRAQAFVSIDGKLVTENTKLIIPANERIAIERWIKNGNLEIGNKFKFIELTKEIEEHKGHTIDDGLVRIEVWKEQVYIPIVVNPTYTYQYIHPWYIYPYPHYHGPYCGCSTGTYGQTYYNTTVFNSVSNTPSLNLGGQHTNSVRSSSLRSSKSSGIGGQNVGNQSINFAATSCNSSEEGVTVPGSKSDQKFTYGSYFPLENNSTVITLKLKGGTGEETVSKPITVKTRVKCVTCGKANKSNCEFCSKCGTAINLY